MWVRSSGMLYCVTGVWLPKFRNHYDVPKRRQPNIQWRSVTSQKNWCPFYRSARNVLSTKNSKSGSSSKATALLRVLHDRETWFKTTHACEELGMSAAEKRHKENSGSNRRIQKIPQVLLPTTNYFFLSPFTGLEWPRGFQELMDPRLHDNCTGWW